jgi:anaerobic selenocysteine-containing dehydrogenase
MEWRQTACILCECNCGIEVRVAPDGGFERIRGDKAHPVSQGYTCEKALRLHHYQASIDRVKSPLRRRADGSYEEIDWDTAIGEVAARLAEIRDAHGGDRIFYYGGGGQGNHLGGAYATATRAALDSRFRSSALAQEKTGEFWVNHRMFGGSVRADFEHAEVAIFLGKNPWNSHGIPQARKTLKAISADPERTLVVIDTRRTETAELANVFLQVRPGTDAYCIAAIGAILVADGLVDHRFIAAATTGYAEVAEALSAVDVADFAARSGIPRDELRAVAHRIAGARSVAVFEDLGIQQAPNSTLVSYLEKLVWVVTGNFAKPGAQYTVKGLVDLANGRESSRRPPVTGARVVGGMIPANVVADEILADHPDRFRAMIVESANPAHSLADSRRMREALKALELVVVIDVAFTETARLADYVLPAPTQYEKWEATFFNFEFPDNAFHLRAPVVEPPPGVLPEPEIHARLCRALGVIDDGVVAELAELAATDRVAFAFRFGQITSADVTMGRLAPVLLWEALGPTLEQRYGEGAASAAVLWGAAHRLALQAPKAVQAAGHTGDGPALGEALFDSIMTSRAGTVMTSWDWEDVWAHVQNGKIALALPDLLDELRGIADQPGLTSAQFPFVLAAGERRAFTANTIMRDPEWRKRDGVGALRISPDDASELQVQPGDLVRVVTATGSITAPVEVTDTLQRGNVTLPNGMGTDYPSNGSRRSAGSSPNELTSTGAGFQDPFVGTPYHKHVPARLEPVRA